MNLKEAKQKIKEIKSLFIKQCRSGDWREQSDDYVNEYFSVELGSTNYIKVDSVGRVEPSYFGISKFFFFILTLMIKINARNYKKNINIKYAADVSDKFFQKHKELKRDSKLDKILN